MRRFVDSLGSWFLAVALTGSCAADEPPAPGDAELKAHLQAQQRKIDNPALDVSVRERLVMELAATLDRTAQAAASPEVRRERWTDAIALIDRFNEANPGHAMKSTFEVQAGVYFWARARSWVAPDRVMLADATARSRATDELNASVSRIRPVVSEFGEATHALAQNARFRLAQSLSDLSVVDPIDDATRQKHRDEALQVLSTPTTEPALVGYAELLRATLLASAGRHEEAQTHLEAAMKANPTPPASDLLDTQVAILCGRSRFAEARKAVDEAKLPGAGSQLLKVRIGLAEWSEAPNGPDRTKVETQLFTDLAALRQAGGAEARVGLMTAATSLREPSTDQAPSAWDLLAEGALAASKPDRAGALETRGADRAAELGQARLAQELRLKAGAAFFQAGDFDQAVTLLARIANDESAGDLRPRAALLRALSLGRQLALHRGRSTRDYEQALRFILKAFPGDPTALEARWLLGKLRLADSDRAEALSLWEGIPHGAARWLESRLAMAALRQSDLDLQRLGNDPQRVTPEYQKLATFLSRSLEEARGDDELNELSLARARLELTPGVGRPDEARTAIERVLRSAARPAQRDAARGFWIITLAQLSRFVEAEQFARRVAGELSANVAVFLETIRLLDRSAAEAETDLKTRRMGLLMGILLRPFSEQPRSLEAAVRNELRLREIRARLFSGDDAGARDAIHGWSTGSLASSPELLRDLAETYSRLDAFELAAEVQRVRARQLASGSLPWLDARYGLALAYFRAGRGKDAMGLIDATAILHPDLGGGELRNKFIRLRQRIEPAP